MVRKRKVIIHCDADSYHCQVYLKMPEYEHLKGSACFVAHSNGTIVSVSAEAKLLGIDKTKKTGLRAHQVLERHPGVEAIWVEDLYGKPDDTPWRMGLLNIREAAKIFQEMHKGIVLEFPLKDEFFMDITEFDWPIEPDWTKLHPNTFLESYNSLNGLRLRQRIDRVAGFRMRDPRSNEGEYRLLLGAIIAHAVINFVENETGFQLSAGIGENKLLAKLATGLHKPNGVTVLTLNGLNRLASSIPIEKINGLGGDTGAKLKQDCGFGTDIMTIQDLRDRAGKSWFRKAQGWQHANWLRTRAWGRSMEPVSQITLDGKISSGKKFREGLKSHSEFFQFAVNLMEDFLGKLKLQSLEVERRIPSTISFQVAYTIPGQRGLHRKTVAVESGAMDIPLAQLDEMNPYSIAMEVTEEIAMKIEEDGVDSDTIIVKEMRFHTKFGDEDFIDQDNEAKLVRFIRTGVYEYSSSDE